MPSAKKYLLVAKTTLADEMAYPSRFFFSFYSDGVVLIIMYFLWRSLYAGQAEVKGLTLGSIITYYAVVFAARKLTFAKSLYRRLSGHVKRGTLVTFLLKPIDFNSYYIVSYLTKRIYQAIIVIGLIAFLTAGLHIFDAPHNLHLFVVSILLASLLNFHIYLTFGLVAFWITDSWGFVSIVGRFINILAGAVIPLAFFPNWVTNINTYLPFRHMVSTPASIYTGIFATYTAQKQILEQVTWLIIIFVLNRLLWRVALKRFDAVGN